MKSLYAICTLKITSDTGIFDFVGIESVGHLLLGGIGHLDESAYKGMPKQVEDTVKSVL